MKRFTVITFYLTRSYLYDCNAIKIIFMIIIEFLERNFTWSLSRAGADDSINHHFQILVPRHVTLSEINNFKPKFIHKNHSKYFHWSNGMHNFQKK